MSTNRVRFVSFFLFVWFADGRLGGDHLPHGGVRQRGQRPRAAAAVRGLDLPGGRRHLDFHSAGDCDRHQRHHADHHQGVCDQRWLESGSKEELLVGKVAIPTRCNRL